VLAVAAFGSLCSYIQLDMFVNVVGGSLSGAVGRSERVRAVVWSVRMRAVGEWCGLGFVCGAAD
jgi:hypothetical protein